MLSSLTNWITRTIADHGLIAVFGLMLLESACIPVPSEVIMLYAGYLVSAGQLGFVAAVAAGVLGNLAGSVIAWWAGKTGGRELILRHGRYIHVTEPRLAMADRWFERYGERVVLISRCVPVVRTFISLPAGIAQMPLRRFALYTTIGCVPWVLALTLLGYVVGKNWETLHGRLAFLDYAIAALAVAGIVWLVVRIRRDSHEPEPSD
ncbi:MAG TPA: DedA family protein [Gaiellales bacterium]|nr:DedA family protein [Gaiellales bacterium]